MSIKIDTSGVVGVEWGKEYIGGREVRFYSGDNRREEILSLMSDEEFEETRQNMVDFFDVVPCEIVDKMADVIEELLVIMDNSEGVAGWHLNGEVAEWSEFYLYDDAVKVMSLLSELGYR